MELDMLVDMCNWRRLCNRALLQHRHKYLQILTNTTYTTCHNSYKHNSGIKFESFDVAADYGLLQPIRGKYLWMIWVNSWNRFMITMWYSHTVSLLGWLWQLWCPFHFRPKPQQPSSLAQKSWCWVMLPFGYCMCNCNRHFHSYTYQ